jgi:hypothetical protein
MTLHSCAVNFTARRCAALYSLWRAAAIAGARASAACFAACASACGRMGVCVCACGRAAWQGRFWCMRQRARMQMRRKPRQGGDGPSSLPHLSPTRPPPTFPYPASPHTLHPIPAKSFLPHALALSLARHAHTHADTRQQTHTHVHARSPMLSLALWLGVATNIRACCDSAMITLQSRYDHAAITL